MRSLLAILVTALCAEAQPANGLKCFETLPLPTYHDFARQIGAQGVVEARLTIKDGKIESSRFLGPDFLQRLAKSAIDRAKIARTCADEQAHVVFDFRIDGVATRPRIHRYEFVWPNRFTIVVTPFLNDGIVVE